MIHSVLKRGDPGLERPCREVTDILQVQGLITDLRDTLVAIQGIYDFSRGSGIAAPQIGEPWRISVINFGGTWYTLVNPTITAHSDKKILVPEGCLSFFDYRGRALRYANVVVSALDGSGKPFTLSSGGDANFASLLQHELGHLDGALYTKAMPKGEGLVYHPGKPHIP